MIGVSLRTLLLYNFGMALIFVIVGLLSLYSIDVTKPGRIEESASFSKNARLAIEREQAAETLRARALFYFDVAREFRLARIQDEVGIYYDARTLSFGVAALFVIGAILALLLLPPGLSNSRLRRAARAPGRRRAPRLKTSLARRRDPTGTPPARSQPAWPRRSAD